MVRGHAKAQAQAAAAKKAAQQAGGKSQLGEARIKGLTFNCPICKSQSPSYKVMITHYESKHPKETVPAEASFAK